MSYAKPYFYNGASKKRLSISCSYKKTNAYSTIVRKAFSAPSYHDPCLCIPQNAQYVAPDLTSTVSATSLSCVQDLFLKTFLSLKKQKGREKPLPVISESSKTVDPARFLKVVSERNLMLDFSNHAKYLNTLVIHSGKGSYPNQSGNSEK